MLDIRLPIAALFGLVGILLGLYGLTTPREVYAISLGLNVNLIWGVVMAAFGALMGASMLLWPDRDEPEPGTPASGEVREKVVPASGHRLGD